MPVKVKRSDASQQAIRTRRPPAQSMPAVEQLRTTHGLDDPALSRCLGVPAVKLLRQRKDKAAPASTDRAKIKRLQSILLALARVMKVDFIRVWLTSPNDALDARAPADYLAQGDYEAVEDLVYFLEAGEPV